jgi:hypothetical protein
MAYETLRELGNLGFTVEIEFDVIEVEYVGGIFDSWIVGPLDGTRGFRLVYSALPKSQGQSVFMDDRRGNVSRGDYVWLFYCERRAAANEPFFVECELPGTPIGSTERVLVKFTNPKLAYQEFAARLYSSEVTLEQVRERGGADQFSTPIPDQM